MESTKSYFKSKMNKQQEETKTVARAAVQKIASKDILAFTIVAPEKKDGRV